MMNKSNEKKKIYVWGRREGGGRVGGCWSRLLALCITFTARGNRTFISFTWEGSNARLKILQLSSGECTVPSPVARSYYHSEISI
jgi:hypothetical protein